MTPYHEDDAVTLYHGDCVDVMAVLEPNSVDAVVCDPPYELGFMGRSWDASGVAYRPETWAAALRVLKPGGHLLAFGGTRTYHRMTVAIEDAGFEVRDCIAWMYGSGFPKSLDVSKAIDKAAGAERQVVGFDATKARPNKQSHAAITSSAGVVSRSNVKDNGATVTAPATPESRQWQGWGTALKPAHEPIVVARKPLTGTVAANVLEHGTGALNIDGTRVGEDTSRGDRYRGKPSSHGGNDNGTLNVSSGGREEPWSVKPGRWPANVALDPEAAAILDEQSGTLTSGAWDGNRNSPKLGHGGVFNDMEGSRERGKAGDSGGASRFFYCAKASKADRGATNSHPTVKPLELMRWLVRLVTPPGGLVLDPFAGSGTTAEACIIEGFKCTTIESHEPYLPIIIDRITKPIQPDMFGGAA